MSSTLTLHPAPNFSQLAVEKIAAELKDFKGDRYGNAVKNHVASTITHFCEQNERFAEVVYKTKRTLSDCCAEIMKGCGTSISDIDVYRGAVRNYFPNADVDFQMTITLIGEAPTAEEMARLLALPCPIGSTVYVIGHRYRAGWDECWINPGKFRPSDLEKIGDRVFLTYEGAKEKIFSMNKSNPRFRFIERTDHG